MKSKAFFRRFGENGAENKEVSGRMNGGGIRKPSKDTIKLVFFIAIIYILLESAGITCPIKFMTGISCAGCGMSRAWLAVLKPDLTAAFKFHPLFFLPPIVVVLYFLRSRINRKIYLGIMYAAGAAFIFIYLYRMLFAGGDIDVFEPENGFFVRILRKFFRICE